MRHYASVVYIALLCAIVPLSASLATGQKSKAPTLQKPQPPTLEGDYVLDEGASDNVEKAIAGAPVRSIPFVSGAVREKLKKVNLPVPQRLAISCTCDEVSITTGQRGTIQTPANGTPIDWKDEDGENIKVSTRRVGGNLERTFNSKNGQRVSVYSLSPDGKELTVQVTITSSYLKRPLTYKLVYRRAA